MTSTLTLSGRRGTYSHTTCSHTPCTHTTYSHTTYSHSQLAHIQLAHIQLAHTRLAHTHARLAHTQLTHTQLAHAQLTWIVTLLGRRGTYGTGLALVTRLGKGESPGTPRLLAWQARHFVTSTLTLSGRRGTYSHTQLTHIQLVHTHTHLHTHTQLTHIQLTHAQLTWIVALRGRRGTYGTGLALVTRLGKGESPGTPRLLAWQARHFVTSTVTLRGRRGTL